VQALVPPAPGTGSTFWVHHIFKSPESAKRFWAWLGGLKPEDWAQFAWKNASLGFHNHIFMPCGLEGPCYCVWESNWPIALTEFQAFMDGPDGPGAGEVFHNTVYRSMPGSALPVSKFPSAANTVRRFLESLNDPKMDKGAKTAVISDLLADEFQSTMEADSINKAQIIGMWTNLMPKMWDLPSSKYTIDHCFENGSTGLVAVKTRSTMTALPDSIFFDGETKIGGNVVKDFVYVGFYQVKDGKLVSAMGRADSLRKHLGIAGEAQPLSASVKNA